LDRQRDGGFENIWKIVGSGTRRHAAEFDHLLGCDPLFRVSDIGRFCDAKNEMILRRDTDIAKLERVKFDAGLAQQLLQEEAADKVTDGKPVRPGDLLSVIG
jgi:hypothetical protein